MRNVLWYYYQVRCDDIEERNEEFTIFNQDGEFIFKELKIPLEIFKQIVEALYYNQIPSYIVVINKDGEILTDFNKKKFVLLKKGKLLTNNFIDLTLVSIKKDTNNIGETWAKKIDYYMLQLKEFGINKEILINSFNYYVGMAENAIGMANRINENNTEFIYAIQHTRLKYPLSVSKYYDPSNMVIDLRIRDLSEYIKDKFFKDSLSMEEIDAIVKKYDLTESEINMLYARLFYPTYYFDLFEDMVIDEEDEEKILQILKKRQSYENLLASFYDSYKNNYNIFEIEWIKKNFN